jgi:hypothetical protein
MGKGARECRTETERSQHAEKEDDVSRRSKEDCRSATSAVGEGEGCSKEVCLKRDHPLWMLPSAGRRTNFWRRRGLATRMRQRKLAIEYIPERGPSGRLFSAQFRLRFELKIFPISDRISAM